MGTCRDPVRVNRREGVMHRIGLLLFSLVAGAVRVASAAATPARLQAGPLIIPDASGDSGTAPDITKLTLTPGTGTVTFDVTYTGTLGTDGDLLNLIDSD